MPKFRLVNTGFAILLLVSAVGDVVYGVTWWVYVVVLGLYIGTVTDGCLSIAAQFFVPIHTKSKSRSSAVAITFDDGPVPGKTEQILRILSEHNASAAFFCIGRNVRDHPSLVMDIRNAGHLLGNHSFHHRNTFDLQTTNRIEEELAQTDMAIEQAAGVVPRFFRPPYGVTNPMVAEAVKRKQYAVIGWSVRSLDTLIRNPARLLRRVTKSLAGGDIILLHDYSDATISILPELLMHINNIGLKIVRVDELLNEKAYHRCNNVNNVKESL
jgi:peptidoglycan/xylan/chitin deacetylase (PgdA/CDA1 family)